MSNDIFGVLANTPVLWIDESETDESDVLLCDSCGLPVHPDIAHWGHDPECARFADSDAECDIGCDLYYHPDCCPECKADPNRYPGGWE